MAPLALLAVWWVAHAAEPTPDITPPDPSPAASPEPKRRGAPADLDIEGKLAREGWPLEDATQLSATWTPPIAPPDPSVRAGRTDGWHLDRLEIRIREVAFAAGEVLTAQRTRSRTPRNPGCVPLEDPGTGDITLMPLDPRLQLEPEPFDPNRMDVTMVADAGERHALVALRPGESATLVEVEPIDPDTPARQRATPRRRLTTTREAVRVEWRETETGTWLCVSPDPDADPDPGQERSNPRQPIEMTEMDAPPEW